MEQHGIIVAFLRVRASYTRKEHAGNTHTEAAGSAEAQSQLRTPTRTAFIHKSKRARGERGRERGRDVCRTLLASGWPFTRRTRILSRDRSPPLTRRENDPTEYFLRSLLRL